MTYRSGLFAVWLLGMAAPVAQAAPLLSADVQISSNPGFFTTYGPVGVTPPSSQDDTSDCGLGPEEGCAYSFSLTNTGFTFTATCDAEFCDMPAFTVTLTNMVFQSGEILANAALQEIDNTYSDAPPPSFGSVNFTSNSVTLSVVAFLSNCFGNLQETVTFTTRAITTETGVPEPSTLSLLGLGALGLAWWRRERRRTA